MEIKENSNKMSKILSVTVAVLVVGVLVFLFLTNKDNTASLDIVHPAEDTPFIKTEPTLSIQKSNPSTLVGKTTGEITEILGGPDEATSSVPLNKAIWLYKGTNGDETSTYLYFLGAEVINARIGKFDDTFEDETWLLTPYIE